MVGRIVRVSATLGWVLGMVLVPSRAAHALPTTARVNTPRSGCANFYITYYYATGSRTRTGAKPYVGEVAVDPAYVALYSRITFAGLEGYGTFLALDTGGAVAQYHADFFADAQWRGQLFVGRTAHRYGCWRR